MYLVLMVQHDRVLHVKAFPNFDLATYYADHLVMDQRDVTNEMPDWENNDYRNVFTAPNGISIMIEPCEAPGCTVTIIRGMTTDNRISCIKTVRKHTGWGLKQAKDWTDALIGHYNDSGWWVSGSNRISVTLKTPDVAENLLHDLMDCGCEGYLS